jgi:hypothetical protein
VHLILDADVAVPFGSVCFYYRRGENWRLAGCDGGGPGNGGTATTQDIEYRVAWNPPEDLGTSGKVDIRAIGVNATGDGLTTNTSSAISLIP